MPTSKQAVMIIATGDFRDEEFQEPFKALKAARVKVDVASLTGEEAKGMLGRKVTPDLKLTAVDVSKYDAVIFVGGSGASELFNNETAHMIARDAAGQGKLLCAICIAPSILANAGVIDGKKATCFLSERANLIANGAEYERSGLVRDGKVITADGPTNATRFAKAVVEALNE